MWEKSNTYDRKTVLMNVRMGMNVTFVLLLASDKRNEVAADTGEAKFSYSSVRKGLHEQPLQDQEAPKD
jgi:hypothetical protein